MARRDIPFAGVLVPDDRIRTAGAASTIQETGTTTTTYQQAGPTAPGAVGVGDDVVLALSGEQAASVYLDIGRGGAPDPARGARLRWADSPTDTLLGWSPPSWIQYTTGTTDLSGSDVVDLIELADGSVMVASANGSTTECATYDPSTDTWTARTDLPWQATAATPSDALLALWQDPDDEAVYALQSDVAGAASVRHMLVRTTDSGTTWSTVAQASFTGGTLTAAGRDARWYRLPSGTHVLVVIGTTTIQTWRSSSGEDWQLVGSLSGIFNGIAAQRAAADVVLLPDGRLVYAYILSATRATMQVRLCDALTDPATAVELDAVTVTGFLNQLSLALEETGRLWALVNHTSNGTRCFRTINYSAWLEDDGNRLLATGSVDEVTDMRKCIQLRGRHLLCTGTPNSGSVGAPLFYHLGGWTSLEPWSVAAGLSARDSDRLTWGASNTADVPWYGITASQRQANLASYGWSLVGTGGSEVTTMESRTIITSAASRYWREDFLFGYDSMLAVLDCKINSTGSTSTAQVGWEMMTNTGAANGVRLDCRISSTAFRLTDGTSTLATVSVDMTDWMQFMVCIESENRLEVYYKRPEETAWTSAYQTASPPNTGTGARFLQWGHLLPGTQQSEWRFVAGVISTSTASSSAKRDQWRSTNSTATARTKVLGRPLAALGGSLGTPASYPKVSLLSVAPTAGTTATVEPAHGYPVDHLDPIASPSPRQVWRSTDTSEQVVEWYLDDTVTTADLTYYGLYLSGANFRSAVLEYYDGATWQTWVSVDLGEAITYSRTGNTIQASSGSPRWLQQHEAVGGYVDLGGGVRRAVAWNATGYGSAAGTRSRIRLDGVTGTDPASGSGTLVLPRGVAASLTQVEAQRVRLRIPTQSTVEGYFELGAMAIGRVYALGSPVDFGSGQSTLIDVREDEAPGYATRSRRSPPRRRWSLAIAESNVAGIRDGVAGYLAADGAPTIGVGLEGDVAPLLEGLLAQGIDASPVLVLPAPPETQDATTGYTTTETRRDVLWWGRVSAVQWDNVVGELGADELHRVATVTIEEDV
jgi:hypothetical protein